MRNTDSVSIFEMFSEIAVAINENSHRLVLLTDKEGRGDHGAVTPDMFDAIEAELAGLEPSEWTPGRYFDLAAETLLTIPGVAPRLYASAFRRAGSALMRKRSILAEDFGSAFAAMATSFRDHAEREPGGAEIAVVWQRAAKAYAMESAAGGKLSACLQAATEAAEEQPAGFPKPGAGELSSILVIRAMRDALSQEN
ncbi:dihydroxyacetone kinase-like protein [Neorhizobium huautlense]|uniref:Dihydroxyacetone kinase-like protein n=1 Tax=Neorhizobium huautlense TaxID=67774 RepID=A0ABT9PR06_9HYPH|nr:DAK2 domain-containing protein [Neorhizobium huautlense]MDP9836890.1 dihydroxyacetone kinase-like protein [Neorhizobium huautlense]